MKEFISSHPLLIPLALITLMAGFLWYYTIVRQILIARRSKRLLRQIEDILAKHPNEIPEPILRQKMKELFPDDSAFENLSGNSLNEVIEVLKKKFKVKSPAEKVMEKFGV